MFISIISKLKERKNHVSICQSRPLILTGADRTFFRTLWQFLLSAERTRLDRSGRWRAYDLGMEVGQVGRLRQRFPWCEVIRFPFEDYPAHVALAAGSYAWKPIILADNLAGEEVPVFWFDSGTLFHTGLDRPLEIVRRCGFWALRSQQSLDRKCDARVLDRLQVPLEVRHLPEWAAGQVGIDPRHGAAMKLAHEWKRFSLDAEAIVPLDAAPYHKQDQSVLNCLLLTACFKGEINPVEDEVDISSWRPYRGISTRNRVAPNAPLWQDSVLRAYRRAYKMGDRVYHRLRHFEETTLDGLNRWYREHFSVHVRNIRTGRTLSIPSPRFGYFADPFIWEHNGSTALFMEEYQYAEDKGRLVVMALSDGLEPGRVMPLDSPTYRGRITSHASYPCVFELDGVPHMIPETYQQRSIDLYVCEGWPEKWTLRRRLMFGVTAVDSMVLHHAGIWWLFTSVARDDGKLCLEIYFTDDLLTGTLHAHPQNQLRRYADQRNGTGRNAGYLAHSEGGGLYRIMQQSSDFYGQGAASMEITVLNKDAFQEVRVPAIPNLPVSIPDLKTHHLSRFGELIAYDTRDRVR